MDKKCTFRVVLDTNQIIGAGSKWLDPLSKVSSNKAREIIKEVAREHVGLYSSKIMAEYLEKLIDRGHPTKRIERYLGLLFGAFELVKVKTKTCSPSPSDPDDVIFLLCALDGKADLLVSNDGHLLGLKGGYSDFSIVNPIEATLALGI